MMKSKFLMVLLLSILGMSLVHAQNTQRKYYKDGSYADVTTNADGSITTVSYNLCNICHGRKVCNLCQGAGGMWGGYGNYRRYAICTSCSGGGQCKYCQGTGVKIFTSTYYPETKSAVGQDFWSGQHYSSGGHSSGSGSSSRSSTTSRSSCSICHGTGVDPFPWKDPTSNAGQRLPWCYTNQSGTKCPYCNEYVWHQHAKCPKCNAR